MLRMLRLSVFGTNEENGNTQHLGLMEFLLNSYYEMNRLMY